MGTAKLQDLRTYLECQEKIDASVERAIALIDCGSPAQDAFDDLRKTISELKGIPAAGRKNAVEKIRNAKINKDRVDAESASRTAMAAEIEALLSHRKNISNRT
ncbi:hypothetical protein SAMN04515617_11677 [Collimonas sp. OK242]|jgi:hypothetical protein|uniref:hypothetical protein n=1 Tax=Collimonas sp. OK242 TaxID=1798195 RepID=UPI0008945844|nr:hypothetical protein [Collimonas sp. OK242]SDY55761.1 hypothetical protein SAMN04515617_11677 [Collimonas sp. OK242]